LPTPPLPPSPGEEGESKKTFWLLFSSPGEGGREESGEGRGRAFWPGESTMSPLRAENPESLRRTPMRWSRYYLYTTREVPNDAEVISHQLMVRTGMIKKLAAGIYTYMPFGWRSLWKLMAIVRREMAAAGPTEV